MVEYVEFKLKVEKEKYEGDDGLRSIMVEALNYTPMVQDIVQAQRPVLNEVRLPVLNEDGSPKTLPILNEDGSPAMIPATNEDGSPKMIANPISEDQFVKISITECVKKFFRDLKNLRNSRRITSAGNNDFELT